jgi:ABC-type glycerol-3-phosphate transport system permease component
MYHAREKPVGIATSLLLLVLFLIWSAVPILWMVRMSFMFKIDAFSIPPKLLFRPTLRHYLDMFSVSYFGGRFVSYFLNSTVVASGATLFSLFLGTLGGYSLSRFTFRGDRVLAFAIIASRMMPPIAFAIPLFFMVRGWGIYDTPYCLILVYTAFHAPFATWMMKGFLDEIPVEIEEAAVVDGCSRMGAFLRTTLPLAAPGFAATAIYNFILSWNEFLFALMFTSLNAKTLPVAAVELIGEAGVEWGPIASMGTMAVLPAIVFTLLSQKYLVRGLTLGAVKS